MSDGPGENRRPPKDWHGLHNVENICHPGKQAFFSARFCQVFIGTQLQRMKFIFHLVTGSQNKYRNCTFLLYLPANLKATDTGKIQVQQNEVGREGKQLFCYISKELTISTLYPALHSISFNSSRINTSSSTMTICFMLFSFHQDIFHSSRSGTMSVRI